MSFVRKNSGGNTTISSESASTLQHLKSEQERIITRISSLQNLLIDNTTSIVKRSKAKVELAQLQTKYTNSRQCASSSRRASLQNLGCRHVVSRTSAALNKRYAERLEYEESVINLLSALQNEALDARERMALEEELKRAKLAIEAIEAEEIKEK